LRTTHETHTAAEHHPDRWSKDLIGTEEVPASNGFNLGIAEYHATDFSQVQVHADQEALYVLSGQGEIQLDGQVYPLSPGTAIYVGPGVAHSTRRTTPAPVRLVYTHGAV
jgi:quercetin dioxygenase-like cupin family protein